MQMENLLSFLVQMDFFFFLVIKTPSDLLVYYILCPLSDIAGVEKFCEDKPKNPKLINRAKNGLKS